MTSKLRVNPLQETRDAVLYWKFAGVHPFYFPELLQCFGKGNLYEVLGNDEINAQCCWCSLQTKEGAADL